MIPNEAVEAAWAEVEAGVLPTKADIQRILEAAAPHMFAEVVEVAGRLASTTLSGDNYMQGRASGFRMAALQIHEATNTFRSQA